MVSQPDLLLLGELSPECHTANTLTESCGYDYLIFKNIILSRQIYL
jgi:hypothetical protein